MSLHVMPSVAAPGDGHVIIHLHHTLVVLVGWESAMLELQLTQ
jgi:hypothetical protein